jgi:hypothetical protein
MLKGARLFLGLVLLLAVFGFGFTARSPLVIAPLAVLFTLSFALGRWRAWHKALLAEQVLASIKAQWSTLLVQTLLVVLLYLLGRGLGSMLGNFTPAAFGGADGLALWGVAIVVLCGGAGIAMVEAQVSVAAPKVAAANAPLVGFVPVTEETFFAGHHYSNITKDESDESVPNPALAFVTEAQITEVEAALGVTFPPLLRRLYLRQNGGYMDGPVAPKRPNPSMAEDDWIAPFSGYDDMTPLRFMRSLQTSIEDYADPVEQPEMFPQGAARLIILAQWYRHTLFLDYRHGDTPRVGFTDFDREPDLQDPKWETRAQWWPDFDSFFASLQRPPEGWPE